MRSAVTTPQRTEVCRNNWHSAGSMGWPFPVLEYTYFFQLKYTEAILSTSTRQLLWLKISKMVIAVLKNRRIVLFCIIFGTLSLPVDVKASAVVAHTATYAVLPLLKIFNLYQAAGFASQHYSVPVPSQDKLRGLRQKGHSV